MYRKLKLRYFLPEFQDHFALKPLLLLLIYRQISLSYMPISIFSEMAHFMIAIYLSNRLIFTCPQTDSHLFVGTTDIDL